jgi:putative transposase
VVRFWAGSGVSEQRARRVAGVPRSTCRYRGSARDQTALRVRLRDLAAARVRSGDRRPRVPLRREGRKVDHERVSRPHREEGPGIRAKRRRKRVGGPGVPPPPARRPHERRSVGFLADGLVDGRRFRVSTIVDHAGRVSPAIEGVPSPTGERVEAVLERLKRVVGTPERIAVDNGPGSASEALGA